MNRIAVTADRNKWKHKLQNAAKFAAFDGCAAKHRKRLIGIDKMLIPVPYLLGFDFRNWLLQAGTVAR